MRISTAVGALLFGASSVLGAQAASTGPRAGAWGAEVTFNSSAGELGGGILRFRSDQSAWILGLDASVDRTRQDNDEGFFPDETRTTVGVTARLGTRSLRAPGSVIRPIVGGGIVGRMAQLSGLQRSWEAGIYGEFGVSRFFGESFSLGMTSDVQLRYAERRVRSARETGMRLSFDAIKVGAMVVF